MNNVKVNTGMHAFHITGICPKQICLLRCTYLSNCTSNGSLHVDPTLLHISIKIYYTVSLIYNTTSKYVPAINMTWNAINMPHGQITWHASMGKVCQYILRHLWGCSLQWCRQTHCTQTTSHRLITHTELATFSNQPKRKKKKKKKKKKKIK